MAVTTCRFRPRTLLAPPVPTHAPPDAVSADRLSTHPPPGAGSRPRVVRTATRGAKAAFLRRVGVPEEQVAAFCRPGLHAGMALGGAHPIDVQLVVEQVLGPQPCYPTDLIRQCLDIRRTGIGANGQVVLFNRRIVTRANR